MQLTRYIASYHRGMGIRCNSISPGGILADQPADFLARYKAHGTNKGMLDPQDVSGALVFLLSDASAYVNGQTIAIDGAAWQAGGGNFSSLRSWTDDQWKAAREAIQATNARDRAQRTV